MSWDLGVDAFRFVQPCRHWFTSGFLLVLALFPLFFSFSFSFSSRFLHLNPCRDVTLGSRFSPSPFHGLLFSFSQCSFERPFPKKTRIMIRRKHISGRREVKLIHAWYATVDSVLRASFVENERNAFGRTTKDGVRYVFFFTIVKSIIRQKVLLWFIMRGIWLFGCNGGMSSKVSRVFKLPRFPPSSQSSRLSRWSFFNGD